MSALLEDLPSLGMLDETLVVMVGEMGRTPKVNAQNRSPGAKRDAITGELCRRFSSPAAGLAVAP